MQADELGREVNRLYWETDDPVTRLAEGLGVSRGTFYNHLSPLRASGRCASCGGSLFFRTRSERDAGEAHCDSCGATQAASPRAARGAAAREPRMLHVERSASDTPVAARDTHEASLLAARASWLDAPEVEEDRRRTQLVIIAVGAAVLGLGILYFARRR